MEDDDGLLTLCGWEQDDEEERQISCSWVKASATKPTLHQLPKAPVKTAAPTPKRALISAALGERQPRQARYKLKSESNLSDGVQDATLEPHKQPRRRRRRMNSAVLRPTLFREDSIEDHSPCVISTCPQIPKTAAPEPISNVVNVNVIDIAEADALLTRCQTLPALPGSYLTTSLSRASWRQEKPSRDQLSPCDSVEDSVRPTPEFRQRKRDLIRRQSSNLVISVSMRHVKPELSRNLRPVKHRMCVRVRDLLMDSIDDDLSRDLEQLSLDPDANRSLWDYEDEETCCSIYENSLGLVKVLTQFNTRAGTHNDRTIANRTRRW